MNKDLPIKKKQVKEILKGLTWAEKLLILEALAEVCRKRSSVDVEAHVSSWKTKNGIPRIKTDY